ncbi:MAG: L-2-amino-thiazoline-4-carboxylic acid hydrolase [Blastocatellia bacterium]
MTNEAELNVDRLNEIGVLRRREIEARIITPLLESLGEEFGRERVLEIARDVIVRVAREQGAQLAAAMGGNSMAHFAASLDAWKKDDALEIEVLEQNEESFSFNVTRCRYAEMYRALGLEELGATLSCNRDGALIEGFNDQITLQRTQTILQGAPHCDFRFTRRERESS